MKLKKSPGQIAIFAALSAFSAGHAAEIKTSSTEGAYIVTIKGEIVKGDFDQLVDIARQKNSLPNGLWIDSVGGNVLEAVLIGRFVRNGLMTVTPENCASACALIALASIRRDIGKLKIHRPYFDRSYFSGLTYEEAQQKQRDIEMAVRKFLTEMDVPTDLSDRMMSASSLDSIEVNLQKFSEVYGASVPSYEEWLISRCGSLKADERADIHALGDLEKIRLATARPDLYNIEDFEKNYGSGARRASMFSSGYREYLDELSDKHGRCVAENVQKERQKLLRELQDEKRK